MDGGGALAPSALKGDSFPGKRARSGSDEVTELGLAPSRAALAAPDASLAAKRARTSSDFYELRGHDVTPSRVARAVADVVAASKAESLAGKRQRSSGEFALEERALEPSNLHRASEPALPGKR